MEEGKEQIKKEINTKSSPFIKGKSIKTLADDMEKALGGYQGGVIKEVIHQQQTKEDEKLLTRKQTRVTQFFLFGSIIVILLAFGILAYWYLTKKPEVLNVSVPAVSLIFTDSTEYLEIDELDKEKIANLILNTLESSEIKDNDIKGLHLVSEKKFVGLRDFIKKINGNLVIDPDYALGDRFLIGITNKKNETGEAHKDLFFLIKISSLRDAFPTMRNWENKMFLDMHNFFDIELTAETSYLLTKDFEDGIMQNKNARILYKNDGTIAMMYVYADNNSLVLTNTENAVSEVMLRLHSVKVGK